MQYLAVLFLIVGLFVFLVAATLGLSYGLGALLNARGRSTLGLSPADPCARFEADRVWYEELPMWQRNVVIVWWLANRYRCNARGCP